MILVGAAQAQPWLHPATAGINNRPATLQPIRISSQHGSDADDHGEHRSERRPAIAPEQAADRARQRFGGRVLNVVLEHGPGGPYYRVKILEHGRVRVVDIDARR